MREILLCVRRNSIFGVRRKKICVLIKVTLRITHPSYELISHPFLNVFNGIFSILIEETGHYFRKNVVGKGRSWSAGTQFALLQVHR